LGLVTGVNTPTPALLMVHADHLGRPLRLTDATRATVWAASYDPFGQPVSITGAVEQNLRFPGQYFLLETGLSYNWHRVYDPATGRYTQPDPLRFVDGPSVYGYATASPMMRVDPEGLEVQICCRPANILGGYVDHCWIETDTVSAGMGGNPNIRPGDEYEGIGMPVQINDHSTDRPTYCMPQENVEEQCVNDRLKIGAPLGRFLPPLNSCQSFAYGVVNSCRSGKPNMPPKFYEEIDIMH
jgi:RHS repeat-associated protein